MKLCGKSLHIEGRFLRVARLLDEGFDYLEDPKEAVHSLRSGEERVDLFTFIPTVADASIQQGFPVEPDNAAVLNVSTYENWWTKQIDGKTRNMVRRAEKKGVVIREAPFDDDFARGIWSIYNESPMRQNRMFPHYGKDFEEVRRMSGTFLDSSVFIGAFLEEQLIGFIKLTRDPKSTQAAIMHILSLIQHRDKAPTNALLAEAVRACATRNIPYMVYSRFTYDKKEHDSLSEFKKSNGFEKVDIPRYYVPLTLTGGLAFRSGLYKGLMHYMPEWAMTRLREYRTSWYSRNVPKHVQSPN